MAHYRIFIALLILITVLTGSVVVQAQDGGDDTAAQELEALALEVHLHNKRTGDFTVWTGGEMGDPSRGFRPSLKMGSKLTDWELPGFDKTQKSFSGTDFERPTVLNIWAAWCWPCIQEFPDVVTIALHPEDHAYDMVFSDTNDDPQLAKDFVAQLPDGLHILLDPQGDLLNRIGSPGIPTSVLFDADGTVLAVHVGSFTPAHERFFEMVAEHPGIGSFDAADYPDVQPIAELQPVSAADAQPITPSRWVEGTIDDDTIQQVYSFEGLKGDLVSVSMEKSGTALDEILEPYLVLLDEDGNRIGESTDYAYEDVARITSIKLPADGVYLIVATRFLEADGLSAGPYRLSLQIR